MGYIIVIEGTDSSGKQTQAQLLTSRLRDAGYNVRMQSFPNYDSPSASPVKMYLDGQFGDKDTCLDAYQASILYATDRLCTYIKDLKAFYESDGILVLDRYVQSNMLHQAGKIRDMEQVDKFLEWLDTLEFDTLKLPRADKIFFLDVPVEVSTRLKLERGFLKNMMTTDIQENNPEHLIHAYNSGKYVSKKYGWHVVPCTIDGQMKSIEEISDMIFSLALNGVKEHYKTTKSGTKIKKPKTLKKIQGKNT